MTSADSPYRPPVAPLESNAPLPGHSLSRRALTHLEASAKWMKAAGIFGALSILIKAGTLVTMSVEWWGLTVKMVIGPLILAVTYVAVVVWVLRDLFSSARLIRTACAGGGDAEAALALRAHRRFWTHLGLGMAIVTGVSVLGMVAFSVFAK